MYLHSTNRSPSSHLLEDPQNNLYHRDCSANIPVLQDDLLFLAKVLQENLRAEVPSGEFFQVKCAVNNDQLMILTQHPKGVWPDTDKTFVVLEETLQSLDSQPQQRVELFLRVAGQKLPYAKYSLTLRDEGDEGDEGVGGVGGDESVNLTSSSSLSSWSSSSSPTPHSPLPTPLLMGVALVLITVLGSAAYFLTRPCVMFECKEIQTAKHLQSSFRQMTRSPQSEAELAKLQQEFNAASASVKTIPRWSLHYEEAEQLSVSLSGESEKINQVVKAFQIASLAAQRHHILAHSLEELQDRQQMWRRAIAPLEVISPNSPLYGLAQPKLLVYRLNLQAVKLDLLTEERWLKKLEAAKAAASVASAHGVATKSLKDLQKVQSSWLLAVNTLSVIPIESSRYQEAQKLLAQYKPLLAAARDRTTKELLATKTYEQAVVAAKNAKSYEQQNQLQAAVAHWSVALNAAQQVPNQSLYYSEAQTLITQYSTAFKQAEEKLQVASSFQKTRTDLDKTCSGAVRVCNFTINNHGITVWITPEYQQILSSSLMSTNDQSNRDTVASVTNHLQTLQQALEVISENASLPLVVKNQKLKIKN